MNFLKIPLLQLYVFVSLHFISQEEMLEEIMKKWNRIKKIM
jgi:hypothetical protein